MSQLANHLPVLKHNWSDGLGRALVVLAGRGGKGRKEAADGHRHDSSSYSSSGYQVSR
jgi:hypothetical protein